jgi:hypothetical protein
MLRLAMPGTLSVIRLPPSPLLTTAPLPLLAVLAVRLRAKPAMPMLRVHPSPPLEALSGLLKTTRAISSPLAPLPPRAALADPQRAMLTLLGKPRTLLQAPPGPPPLLVLTTAVGLHVVSHMPPPRHSLTKAALEGPLTLRLVAVDSGGTPRLTPCWGNPLPWSRARCPV